MTKDLTISERLFRALHFIAARHHAQFPQEIRLNEDKYETLLQEKERALRVNYIGADTHFYFLNVKIIKVQRRTYAARRGLKTLVYRLSTVPHWAQRYPTVGDWIPGEGNSPSEIVVSQMGNEDYEFLVMIHELIEFHLCKKRGITDEVVSKFDKQYEEDRAAGLHSQQDEPGDDVFAPYRREHFFATNIERQLAHELGVDWEQYAKTVEGL